MLNIPSMLCITVYNSMSTLTFNIRNKRLKQVCRQESNLKDMSILLQRYTGRIAKTAHSQCSVLTQLKTFNWLILKKCPWQDENSGIEDNEYKLSVPVDMHYV